MVRHQSVQKHDIYFTIFIRSAQLFQASFNPAICFKFRAEWNYF